jgi:hypothetical protein
MKHKVDWLSQQYRIRAEYAHRVAIEAWERQIDERQRLINGLNAATAPEGVPAGLRYLWPDGNMTEWPEKGQKH